MQTEYERLRRQLTTVGNRINAIKRAVKANGAWSAEHREQMTGLEKRRDMLSARLKIRGKEPKQ